MVLSICLVPQSVFPWTRSIPIDCCATHCQSLVAGLNAMLARRAPVFYKFSALHEKSGPTLIIGSYFYFLCSFWPLPVDIDSLNLLKMCYFTKLIYDCNHTFLQFDRICSSLQDQFQNTNRSGHCFYTFIDCGRDKVTKIHRMRELCHQCMQINRDIRRETITVYVARETAP